MLTVKRGARVMMLLVLAELLMEPGDPLQRSQGVKKMAGVLPWTRQRLCGLTFSPMHGVIAVAGMPAGTHCQILP